MKGERKKILLVDDEYTVLCLMREVLVGEGYEVITATNGLDEIKKIKEAKPDLVIVDVMMPYLDGYHMVYRIINEEWVEKLPQFIIISVRPGMLDKGFGERIGAHAYLSKPFRGEKLVQLVWDSIGSA